MSLVHWLIVLISLSSLVFALSVINRWKPRTIVSLLVTLNTIVGLGFAFGCATLKPEIEVARSDFEQACRALAQATIGDAHPDQAEVIAQKLCFTEQLAARVTNEILAARQQLFQQQPPPALLVDAGF